MGWAVSGGRFADKAGSKRQQRVLLGPRRQRRIGRLRAILETLAQQPGTPGPPGTPPQPRPDPTAPPPYEDPPRPIPIPRPDQPPDVIDDPAPRPNAKAFTGAAPSRSLTTSTSPDPSGKANDVPPGFRSPAGAGCVSTAGDRGDGIGAIFIRSAEHAHREKEPTIEPSLVANYHPMREADHVYKDRPGRFGEPGDARGRRTPACHNCLHLRDRFWDPRLSGAGATVLAADPHLGTGKANCGGPGCLDSFRGGIS
jgi:hypothetical protein